MMKKIYAVSRGEYSDYSVLAVCENEKTAAAWAAAINLSMSYMNARVEEIFFIGAKEKPYSVHSVRLNQDLWNNGTMGEFNVHETDNVAILDDDAPRHPAVDFIVAPCHAKKGGRLEIRGQSKSAVMKVYSEQLAMWQSAPAMYRKGK